MDFRMQGYQNMNPPRYTQGSIPQTPPKYGSEPRSDNEISNDAKYRIPRRTPVTPIKMESNFMASSTPPAATDSLNYTIHQAREHTYDVSQCQKYDGIKRAPPTEYERPSYDQRPRFKCTRPYPGEVPMVLEGYPEKDDELIQVDPWKVDRRWNIWNLPSKAKVLLVSNLNRKMVDTDAIFNIFGHYGDVTKVKLIKDKDGTEFRNIALIQFRTATFAKLARDMLDQFEVYDEKLAVSFSKYEKILSEEECGIENRGIWKIKDFEGLDYTKYRRFANEEKEKLNLERSFVKPSATLYALNFEPQINATVLKELAQRHGFEAVDAMDVQERSERKIMLEFASISEAVMAMAFLTGNPEAGSAIFYFFSDSIRNEKS